MISITLVHYYVVLPLDDHIENDQLGHCMRMCVVIFPPNNNLKLIFCHGDHCNTYVPKTLLQFVPYFI